MSGHDSCKNCEFQLVEGELKFVCENCSHWDNPDTFKDINYFTLFGMPDAYELENVSVLEGKYKKFQL